MKKVRKNLQIDGDTHYKLKITASVKGMTIKDLIAELTNKEYNKTIKGE